MKGTCGRRLFKGHARAQRHALMADLLPVRSASTWRVVCMINCTILQLLLKRVSVGSFPLLVWALTSCPCPHTARVAVCSAVSVNWPLHAYMAAIVAQITSKATGQVLLYARAFCVQCNVRWVQLEQCERISLRQVTTIAAAVETAAANQRAQRSAARRPFAYWASQRPLMGKHKPRTAAAMFTGDTGAAEGPSVGAGEAGLAEQQGGGEGDASQHAEARSDAGAGATSTVVTSEGPSQVSSFSSSQVQLSCHVSFSIPSGASG